MLPEEREFSTEQRLMHALNNDLNVIVSSCDLLDCLIRDSEAEKHVGTIRNVARKIADEISELQRGQASIT